MDPLTIAISIIIGLIVLILAIRYGVLGFILDILFTILGGDSDSSSSGPDNSGLGGGDSSGGGSSDDW